MNVCLEFVMTWCSLSKNVSVFYRSQIRLIPIQQPRRDRWPIHLGRDRNQESQFLLHAATRSSAQSTRRSFPLCTYYRSAFHGIVVQPRPPIFLPITIIGIYKISLLNLDARGTALSWRLRHVFQILTHVARHLRHAFWKTTQVLGRLWYVFWI